MSGTTFDRRKLLAGAGGAAALLGTGALSGCGGGSTGDQNTVDANTNVALPTYVKYTGITPDLPGTDTGVDPAFRNFPKENPKTVEGKPGNGETVTGMANIYYAVPPGPDNNSYWAGLNERLGVDLKIQMVGNADYEQKFATTIAGNDLPDILQMRVVANTPQLLEKRFTRLDEHLSGDAIKEYPNLANIPTFHWKPTVYNGGIYGIPIPRGAVGGYNFIRQDLFDAAGVSAEPKGYAELLETAKALTDPKKRRWAFGLWGQLRSYLLIMNEAPTGIQGWRNDGGKLTHTFETEQFKQTIVDISEFWKAGVMHPDAFDDQLPFKNYFNAGTVAINAMDGYPGWTQYILDNSSNPNFKLGLMPAYTRESGELAPWHKGGGFYSTTAIKKQDDPEKLKLILRVLNWLAAPFGTEEYLYRLYGQEGVDHTVNEDGDPVFTKTGTANTVIPIRYFADAPYSIYQPGRPDDADTQHAYQEKVLAKSISNPVIGLFSNTFATKNAVIEKKFNDGVKEIIQGRKDLATLDDLLKSWRSEGGDGMRQEYQDQLQAEGPR
jgi:putative aldouronate transport system substrate-binding protein